MPKTFETFVSSDMDVFIRKQGGNFCQDFVHKLESLSLIHICFLISTVLAVGGGDDLFLSDGWRGWYRSDVAGTVYGASVLLFGGIGLLVSFVIEMNMKKKENK